MPVWKRAENTYTFRKGRWKRGGESRATGSFKRVARPNTGAPEHPSPKTERKEETQSTGNLRKCASWNAGVLKCKNTEACGFLSFGY